MDNISGVECLSEAVFRLACASGIICYVPPLSPATIPALSCSSSSSSSDRSSQAILKGGDVPLAGEVLEDGFTYPHLLLGVFQSQPLLHGSRFCGLIVHHSRSIIARSAETLTRNLLREFRGFEFRGHLSRFTNASGCAAIPGARYHIFTKISV
jgi:hypothetical protein